MKVASLSLLVLLLALVTACRSISDEPSASATLVQKWSVDEFVREIEQNVEYRAQPLKKTSVPPSYFLPFGASQLKQVKRRAQEGDRVLWYADRWFDTNLDYICLQRGSAIIWSYKMAVVDRSSGKTE